MPLTQLVAIKDLDRGTSTVRRRVLNEKLKEHGQLTKEDYDRRMVKFNNAKDALSKASSSFEDQITLEEPLPPNAVDTYAADTFGLDKAARDCRFEMIKVVREVNEVTSDPQVATAVDRNFRYLSPNVFRLLLPVSWEMIFQVDSELTQHVIADRQRTSSFSRRDCEDEI